MTRVLGLLARALGWATLLLLVLLLRAWPIWPAPQLPAGERLGLQTEPPHLLPHIGCPAAALGQVVLRTEGDKAVFVSENDRVRPVRWPTGWAAWRIDGVAYLLDDDLTVVVREGVLVDGFGGGYCEDPANPGVETFHVCRMFG